MMTIGKIAVQHAPAAVRHVLRFGGLRDLKSVEYCNIPISSVRNEPRQTQPLFDVIRT